MLEFSTPILQKGVSSVAVTMGKKGVLACWKGKDKKFFVNKIDALNLGTVKDATGCGDTFAAAFITKFQKTQNYLDSYLFANKIAALKASCNNFMEFRKGVSTWI